MGVSTWIMVKSLITANQIGQQQILLTQWHQVFNRPLQLLRVRFCLIKVINKIRGARAEYSLTLAKILWISNFSQATDNLKERWIKDLCNNHKTHLHHNKHWKTSKEVLPTYCQRQLQRVPTCDFNRSNQIDRITLWIANTKVVQGMQTRGNVINPQDSMSKARTEIFYMVKFN